MIEPLEIRVTIVVTLDGKVLASQTLDNLVVRPLSPSQFDELVWTNALKTIAELRGVKGLTFQRFRHLEFWRRESRENQDKTFRAFREHYGTHREVIQNKLGEKTFARLEKIMDGLA